MTSRIEAIYYIEALPCYSLYCRGEHWPTCIDLSKGALPFVYDFLTCMEFIAYHVQIGLLDKSKWKRATELGKLIITNHSQVYGFDSFITESFKRET